MLPEQVPDGLQLAVALLLGLRGSAGSQPPQLLGVEPRYLVRLRMVLFAFEHGSRMAPVGGRLSSRNAL